MALLLASAIPFVPLIAQQMNPRSIYPLLLVPFAQVG